MDFGGTMTIRLDQLRNELARSIGCEVSDLRLDHDPPLAARRKLQYSSVIKPTYFPDANDPDHLAYRPHGTQFDGSHDTKTRIRGDRGQLCDISLIKKLRRIERGPKPKRGPKIQSAGFASKSGAKLRSQKQKWPKRKFETRRK